ncbi:hypothetical protein [Chitinophaga deserti]|uniref:hypothetical protein n=1 Tax=Chitinophaga deserti TaxID=2164099 RepID=UPI000D6AC608|nr:hypothetical protein [Chitinophaga deserti]
MNTLDDPRFLRYRCKAYLLLAGLFILTVAILLQSRVINISSPASPLPDTPVAVAPPRPVS